MTVSSGGKGFSTAYYHVAAAGSGQVVVFANGTADAGDDDTGYVAVTVAPPAAAPVVSTAPHNGGAINVGACIAACFAGTWSHTTPAYYTLGQAHATTLVYNSATASPLSTIALDVHAASGHTPTTYGFQAKLESSGTNLTFLNGATSVYYAASGTQVNRVLLLVDPRANSLTTGGYRLMVTATAYYGTDSTAVNTFELNLLVVDEGGSPFGKGVNVAGVQRAYTGADGSVLITEGDGSVTFYSANSGFATPGGSNAGLVPVSGGGYARGYPDGSVVGFNSAGREIYAKDPLKDSTIFTYSDTLLTRITDRKFGRLMFKYSSGHLIQLYDSLTGTTPRRTNITITSGKLVSIQDPDSLSTAFTYDAKNRVTALTDRAGLVTNVYYDTLGFVDSTKGPTFNTYPSGASRQVIRLSDAVTGAWQMGTAGTSSGSPKAAIKADTLHYLITDPGGATTTYALDRFGQMLKAVNVLGAIDSCTRDTSGRITMMVPAGHNETTYTWSTGTNPSRDHGSPYLLLEAATHDGTDIVYTYNANLEVSEVNGTIETQNFTYGSTLTHKLASVAVGGVTQMRYYFNGLGQDTAVVDTAGHRTRWQYDGLANADTTYDPRGARTIVGRDQYGRDTSVTPLLSGTTYTFYDKLNRITKTRNPYGQEVASTYDSLGRLVRLKDGKGQVYKFSYSPVGVTAQYDLGDTTKADTYGYDFSGRPIKVFTRRGDTLTMAYDTLSRLVSRTGPDFPAESLSYDSVGRRVVAWNANATDTTLYDALGQLARQSQRLNGQVWAFTYDYYNGRLQSRSNVTGYGGANYAGLFYTYPGSNGPMTSMTDAGVTANLNYNSERLRDSIIYNPFGSSWTFSQQYNKDHADSTHTFSNGSLNSALGGSFQYDSLDRLINQSYGGAFNQRQFKYDSLGRLSNYCDYAFTPWFCENEFGKLLGDTLVAYTYDSAGNRLVEGDSLSWIGAGNRIRRTRNWYYTYDANGNVLTKCTSSTGCTSGYKYTWNAIGELVTVKNQGDTVLAAFKYDALGHRIEKTAGTDTLRFVYDGDQVILDLNANNSPRTEYGYQPGGGDIPYSIKQDSNSAGRWTGAVVADPMVGTVLGIVNYTGGGLIKQYAVDPWGRPTAADTGVKTRLRLAGQEYDAETGLYHMGARYYDPDAGRFLSEDPIGMAGGLNLYAYAGGNPVLIRDPAGLSQTHPCPRGQTDDGHGGCIYEVDPLTITSDGMDEAMAQSEAEFLYDEEFGTYGNVTLTGGGASGGTGGAAGGGAPTTDNPTSSSAHRKACLIASLSFLGNAALDLAGIATGGEVLADLARAGTAVLEHEVVTIAVNGAKSPVLTRLATEASVYGTTAAAKANVHVATDHSFDPLDLIPGHASWVSGGEAIDACF